MWLCRRKSENGTGKQNDGKNKARRRRKKLHKINCGGRKWQFGRTLDLFSSGRAIALIVISNLIYKKSLHNSTFKCS